MKKIKRVLRNPFLPLACIVLGSIAGSKFPILAVVFAPISDFFLALFKMCALPIVIMIVLESFYKIMHFRERKRFIYRALRIFAISLVCCAGIGILSAQFLSRFLLENAELLSMISERVARVGGDPVTRSSSFAGFLIQFVPQNIFSALVEGHVISCVVFFALMGAALASIENSERIKLHETIKALKETLFKMLSWFLRLLPIAVFSIFVKMFATMGGSGLRQLMILVGFAYVPMTILFIFQWGSLFLLRRSRILGLFRGMKESLIIAFSTSSSILPLPKAMQEVAHRGRVQIWAAETIMPLSVTFNPQGSVVFYTYTVSIGVMLSGIPLSLPTAIMIAFGAMLQGICSSGMPSLVSLGTLAMIFGAIGLPVEVVTVVFLMVMAFIDPAISTLNLMGHAWSVSILERRKDPNLRPTSRI